MEALFTLIAAPAEAVAEREYQDELHQIEARSRVIGSPVYDRSQSAAGIVPLPYLGEFMGVLQPAAITGLAGLIGAWINARLGRKVRVKVGDIEVEANTTEEVDRLLAQAQGIKQATESKRP